MSAPVKSKKQLKEEIRELRSGPDQNKGIQLVKCIFEVA